MNDQDTSKEFQDAVVLNFCNSFSREEIRVCLFCKSPIFGAIVKFLQKSNLQKENFEFIKSSKDIYECSTPISLVMDGVVSIDARLRIVCLQIHYKSKVLDS